MDLSDFTTYDDIRAVLGVSTDELEDTTIALSVYSVGLEADLRSLRVSFLSDHAAVKAVAEGSRTDAQEWFLRCSTSFATYSMAAQLSDSLPMFAPKDITDGKASVGRFAANPYERTLEAIRARYTETRNQLQAALEAAVPVSTVVVTSFRPSILTGRPVDPVTGV